MQNSEAQSKNWSFLDDSDEEAEADEVVLSCALAQPQDTVDPEKYVKCLQKEFGHYSFRPLQWKIIRALIEQRCDVCAVICTGYGKSLMYQFPAVYLGKVTLVVSPLISLMTDQVRALNLTRERACLLGSAQSDNAAIEQRILQLEFSVIYITPERINSERGLALLRALGDKLALVAVDEAHCISQFGHDFRPAYRCLKQIRAHLPQVPLLALTATATLQVRDDICCQLQLRQPLHFSSGFDRPNLEFIVRPMSSFCGLQSAWHDIGASVMWAVKQSGSAIVYCNTRKQTEQVAADVDAHVPCRYYHSGLTQKQRKQYFEEFACDEVRVMVATMAFGMGIDKPDVRVVVHYGAPSDLERYYQEVGRAGRDGLPAKCLLLHSPADWQTHQSLRQLNRTSSTYLAQLMLMGQKMVEYTRHSGCRRQFILEYFGHQQKTTARRDCCDNCFLRSNNIDYNNVYEGLDAEGQLDVSTDAELLLTLFRDMQARCGLTKVVMLLRGSKRKDMPHQFQKHSSFGKGASKPEEWWKLLTDELKTLGYLRAVTKACTFGAFTALQVTSQAEEWLDIALLQRRPIMVSARMEIFKFLQPKKHSTASLPHSISLLYQNMPDLGMFEAKNELLKALMR